ncbi:MAG: histidine phosphatase family protein [Anaerolineae bacterium]|nr:histidine phosphatase family protein [Anaerolineae bacterium]
MELYIIRHAQSVNNAMPDDQQRVPDAPLTELGHEQAQRLAEYLRDGRNRDPWYNPSTGYSRLEHEADWGITHLYASPMTRALQTCQPIAAALGLQPNVWVETHEHGGVYQQRPEGIAGFTGRTRAEIEDGFPGFLLPAGVTEQGWWNPARGSETMPEAIARAIKVAADLRRRADSDERLLMVTHGTFIDALIKALFFQLPSRALFYLHYNTAITRIDFVERERLLVRYLNRTAHLPPEKVS